MIRTVIVVALAAALLAASLPAIDLARVQRSDAEIRDELDGLLGEARTLAATSDAVSTDGDPARRTVTLRFPTAGFASAGTERVRITAPRPGGSPAGTSSTAPTLSWRVDGGANRSLLPDGVPIRRPAGDPLVIETGGRYEIVLSLVERGGDRAVVVERRST